MGDPPYPICGSVWWWLACPLHFGGLGPPSKIIRETDEGAIEKLSGLAKRIADGAGTLTAGTPEDVDALAAKLA